MTEASHAAVTVTVRINLDPPAPWTSDRGVKGALLAARITFNGGRTSVGEVDIRRYRKDGTLGNAPLSQFLWWEDLPEDARRVAIEARDTALREAQT